MAEDTFSTGESPMNPKDTKSPGAPLRLGIVIPILALLGLLAAGYVGFEACTSEQGCIEGAREIGKAVLPDWMRKALRGLVGLVLSPWLWILMAVVAVIEKWKPARADQKTLSNGLVHDLLAWFLLDKLAFGFLIATVFSYSAALSLYQEHLAFLTVPWFEDLPQPAIAAIAFLVSDFLNWFHHLVRHKVRGFWVFHAVHHSQREMNIFTDDRVHPIDRLIAMPIALVPMLALGLEGHMVPWVLIAQMIYTHAYHANLETDYGPLRYLFVTPQSHRVHHSELPEHADTNFGVVFCIWDRLFGTHVDAVGEYPQTGVDDEDFPMEQSATIGGILRSYVRQFFYPFVQIGRRVTTGRWELPAG